MNLCMAATYDPDPERPMAFDCRTILRPASVSATVAALAANDPINLVPRYARSLRSLEGIYIDCGWRDQFIFTMALAGCRAFEPGAASRIVRGIRRQSFGRRLSLGRQPAVSLSSAEAVAASPCGLAVARMLIFCQILRERSAVSASMSLTALEHYCVVQVLGVQRCQLAGQRKQLRAVVKVARQVRA